MENKSKTLIHETGHFLMYYQLSSRHIKKSAVIILYSKGPIKGQCIHKCIVNDKNQSYILGAGIAAEMWLAKYHGKPELAEKIFNTKVHRWEKDMSDISKLKSLGITKTSDLRVIIEEIINVFDRKYSKVLQKASKLEIERDKYYNAFELYKDLLP